MPWPSGFLWGTGASSTQCEGAAPRSDWIAWERAGRAPRSGEGNDFATRYVEDFAAYRDLGLTQHRPSIEWARIEPDEGRVDQAAVAHHRRVLAAARDAGVTPWICLHRFTLPDWFAASGLGLVLDRLHAELPGTPLLVSEYGIGTADDAQRADDLRRRLAIAQEAITRGIDLRGFFHWTGVDNYEWLLGYDVAFGLIDRERRLRASAEVLRNAALGDIP
jgi:beta-glucosidase/6-phospho-beta-glucosidase/beta-galactosidase